MYPAPYAGCRSFTARQKLALLHPEDAQPYRFTLTGILLTIAAVVWLNVAVEFFHAVTH